jgi:hypothetical protein
MLPYGMVYNLHEWHALAAAMLTDVGAAFQHTDCTKMPYDTVSETMPVKAWACIMHVYVHGPCLHTNLSHWQDRIMEHPGAHHMHGLG